MTSGYAAVNGAQLHCEVKGVGPPLLLLHAGIADSRMWDEQFEPFAQHFQTIRFDLRGFGRSHMPPGHFSNYKDVAGLMDYLGLESACVLGISFGGLIALDFALAYPERVSALVLGAPSVSGDTPSARIQQFWAEEDESLERGDLEAATELNLRLWVDGPHRSPEEVDREVRERVRIMQLDAFRMDVPDDVEERPLNPSAISRLSELEVPTLIIVGSIDLEEKVTLAGRLSQAIHGASTATIDNVAHMINMEQPERFNQLVLSFLKTGTG